MYSKSGKNGRMSSIFNTVQSCRKVVASVAWLPRPKRQDVNGMKQMVKTIIIIKIAIDTTTNKKKKKHI
jgi:hypothetical protein